MNNERTRKIGMFARAAMVALFVGLVGGCATTEEVDDAAPLLGGLGDHTRSIGSANPEAQRYFDQGLTLAYAFNHDEAIRSFTRAAELEPSSPMPWWGVALCNGPHINNPAMDEAHSRAAWEALEKAQAKRRVATEVDRALIEALAARYSADPAADRKVLDQAYAEAMREVWKRFPRDPDVGALFAESMMDLRPWDLWLKSQKGPGHAPTAQPGTEEIVATLERVLTIDPTHPGANHLYIHTMEASPNPERAVPAADRLRTLVPGAGHMVHMPSHIDIRTGSWRQAAEANERAIVADTAYRKVSPKQGFYNVYMAHNHHFLTFTAMMEGRKEAALAAARHMLAGVPEEFIATAAALADPVMSIEYDVHKRFGMWEELLKLPAPDSRLPITTAMWRFNRGVALSALGRSAEARAEQEQFRQAVKAVPAEAIMAINNAQTVLSIAEHMLEGELLLADGRVDEAVGRLRKGVEIEDTLLYMEPPDWIQPVRHALGAALVKAKRFAEAEKVYRDDLVVWPENAWSLLGLRTSLEAQGKSAEAAKVAEREKKAWARADVRPGTSCMCVAGEK